MRPETFNQMVAVMQQAKQQLKPGRPSKLSIEDQVLMTLEYLREYRTYFHIAQNWGIYESTAYRIIRTVEGTLISSGKFSLPGKKKLLEPEHTIEVVVVDVPESPIRTSPKKQKRYYSGKSGENNSSCLLPWQKETAYTGGGASPAPLKSQVVVDQSTKQIICTAQGKGHEHDFH